LLTLEVFLGNVVELNASDDGSLLHVRIHIIQTILNRLLQVLLHTLEPEGAQTSECETPDFVVLLLAVDEESVDCQNCQVLVLLCIVDQVKIYHLLHDDIISH
jgi:hypothetical protein